eukprot:scaffold3061_cov106-Isochrysis_galbana.AAC.1
MSALASDLNRQGWGWPGATCVLPPTASKRRRGVGGAKGVVYVQPHLTLASQITPLVYTGSCLACTNACMSLSGATPKRARQPAGAFPRSTSRPARACGCGCWRCLSTTERSERGERSDTGGGVWIVVEMLMAYLVRWPVPAGVPSVGGVGRRTLSGYTWPTRFKGPSRELW